jgi:hypothetical protein
MHDLDLSIALYRSTSTMARKRNQESKNVGAVAVNNLYCRWYNNFLLLLVMLLSGSFICELRLSSSSSSCSIIFAHAEATADARSYPPLDHNHNHRQEQQQQQEQEQQEGYLSRVGGGGGDDNDDSNNGVVQVIESEIWDASENEWKGAPISGSEGRSRWSNEQGKPSPSPLDVIPPVGWEFVGEWKIVVKSSTNNDSKGWEYQFQYLRPPKRRRIWLRSLTQQTTKILKPSRARPSRLIPKTPSPPTTLTTTEASTKVKRLHPTNSLTRTMQKIRDDWNYKGLGCNLYKSFIFPSSVGVAVRLPLTINFDTFDRNPAWPIISSSVGAFYPPMAAGYLSWSVHVEWVKWIMKYSLGLIPRVVLLIVYRFVLPVLWTIASIMLFSINKHTLLPSRPTTIPNRSWWTGGNIAKPHYNTELSERIGGSVSYRWSKRCGYEWRITYWHAYLPTLLVYQQFLSQLQERFRNGITKSTTSNNNSKSSSSSLSSAAEVSSSSTTTKSSKKTKQMDWWRKHFASLGVSTSGPIPDTPPISCSANLSLSGLYWGSRQGSSSTSSTSFAATTTPTSTTGSRTDTTSPVTDIDGGNLDDIGGKNLDNDIIPSSARVLPKTS